MRDISHIAGISMSLFRIFNYFFTFFDILSLFIVYLYVL